MIQGFNLTADIEAALVQYPRLKLEQSNTGKLFVSGKIELLQEGTGLLIDVFSVDIQYPDKFPYCFPKVWEVGGKIERVIERHINPKDNSLCLVVPPEERLLCKYGITTVWFLDEVLVPRLGEEFGVNNGEKYQREYAHGGANGSWEFYMYKLGTADLELVLHILKQIVANELPEGRKPCICGSGKKFKKCHLKSVYEIFEPGNAYLQYQIETLSKEKYTGKKK